MGANMVNGSRVKPRRFQRGLHDKARALGLGARGREVEGVVACGGAVQPGDSCAGRSPRFSMPRFSMLLQQDGGGAFAEDGARAFCVKGAHGLQRDGLQVAEAAPAVVGEGVVGHREHTVGASSGKQVRGGGHGGGARGAGHGELDGGAAAAQGLRDALHIVIGRGEGECVNLLRVLPFLPAPLKGLHWTEIGGEDKCAAAVQRQFFSSERLS